MIYGIGSTYDGVDKFDEFIRHNVVCIGWDRDDAPAIYQLFAKIAVGDIVFIKSFPPSQGLYIKAVGIVTTPDVIPFDPRLNQPNLGYGRNIAWVWTIEPNESPIRIGRLDDHYDYMRGGTLYEELGPEVQQRVIEIVMSHAVTT